MSPRNLRCSRCNEGFTTKLKYQSHMKMHEETKLALQEGLVEKPGDTSKTVDETAPENGSDEKDSVKVEKNGESPPTKQLDKNGIAVKDQAAKSGSEKAKNNVPKPKRRQFKCQKCDQILGTSNSLKRHQAACEVVAMEVDISSEEDIDDIERDEDYVEGRSQNSRIPGLQCIIDKGTSEAVRMKSLVKNSGTTKAKKRPLKKAKEVARPKPEVNETAKPPKKTKAPTKKKKKDDENVQPLVPVSLVEATQDSLLAGVHLCTKCEFKFPDAEALRVHMQIHVPKPPVKQHQCFVCKSLFSRKYHLDRHVLMTACSGRPPPAWPCQVCGKVYTRKDNLREHLRAHAGEVLRRRKHKCEYCQKQFHGVSLLNIHIRTHTGEKPFKCDFCEKGFPSQGALGKHRRVHTGEKPYSCGDCGMRFSLKGTLNRHMRIHTGVRPHKCKLCGKEFIQIGGLTAHMFYHTGDSAFRCEKCGKNFNRKARLQMHIRYVHEKLKPYSCDQCTKSFTRKEDLARHQVLHTGEKPFQCPTCLKKFAIKPSLKMHLLTHTKEEPRSCHECGRAFIRKDCLLRHMRKRHRDLLDKILLDEKDQKTGDSADANSTNPGSSSHIFNESNITESIRELLSLLVDEPTLKGFGWPFKPVDELLEAVIRRCGHTPVNPDDYTYIDRLRENSKLLFTVVIDDNAVKTLLNNQTVDEVILHVLRLAKS